jgi:hypothetical protein
MKLISFDGEEELICHLHYKAFPCDDCDARAVLARVFGAFSERSASPGAPAVIVFKEAIFEHIYDPWETPRPIDNPQTLRDECDARGVTSVYLRDSGLWRTHNPKWF